MRVQLPMEEGDFEARARAERSSRPPAPWLVPTVRECPYPHRDTSGERCRACSHYCGVWLDGAPGRAFVLCSLEAS